MLTGFIFFINNCINRWFPQSSGSVSHLDLMFQTPAVTKRSSALRLSAGLSPYSAFFWGFPLLIKLLFVHVKWSANLQSPNFTSQRTFLSDTELCFLPSWNTSIEVEAFLPLLICITMLHIWITLDLQLVLPPDWDVIVALSGCYLCRSFPYVFCLYSFTMCLVVHILFFCSALYKTRFSLEKIKLISSYFITLFIHMDQYGGSIGTF